MQRNTVLILISILFNLFSASLLAGEIKVGMSTALSGPAQALGRDMKLGIETYFNKINKAGGVNGNTLKLITYDDGYEPERAAPNMRKLINEDKVLAVLGNVGTPTAMVTVPIANEGKTLMFGAFTGAGVLRKTPPDRYVINYRASYAKETAAMIKGLMSIGIKPNEIAFFTQNDGYGDAGYDGAVKALEKNGYTDAGQLAHGRYTRNTVDVDEALATVLETKVEPKAIIMVGAYKPCAKFIVMAKKQLKDALFLNVSFVGSNPLKNELKGQTDNVVVTQVVPHFNSKKVGIQEYQLSLKEFDRNIQPGFVSLEGYIVAKIFVHALSLSNDVNNREELINAFEKIKGFNVGIGKGISFNSDDHEGMRKIWPTVIKDNKYIPLKQWKNLI